tara:strand:+ start:576 stop:908 length:333 start_codon:yes stop_codon:yes gene_type:complete
MGYKEIERVAQERDVMFAPVGSAEVESLLLRMGRVENTVTMIEEKVGTLLEQGTITNENVEALTSSLHEEKDHFAHVRRTLQTEIERYRRVFVIGATLIVLMLMWLLVRT